MSDEGRRYWFPAKRYGWGWGPPSTWEGWVVLIAWVAAVSAGAVFSRSHPALYVLFAVGMVVILLAICFAKGEPPRWRWGESDKTPRG